MNRAEFLDLAKTFIFPVCIGLWAVYKWARDQTGKSGSVEETREARLDRLVQEQFVRMQGEIADLRTELNKIKGLSETMETQLDLAKDLAIRYRSAARHSQQLVQSLQRMLGHEVTTFADLDNDEWHTLLKG